MTPAVARGVCHLTAGGDLAPGRGPAGARRVWPYTQSWKHLLRRRPALVDPVNLLVLEVGPREVLDRLAAAGWRAPAEGGRHVILLGGWRPRPMTGHVERGDAEERDHLRVWAFGPHTLAAAHHEVRGAGGRGHRVTSWDAARDRASEDLAAGGLRPLTPTGIITAPGLRRCASDGRAWRLRAA